MFEKEIVITGDENASPYEGPESEEDQTDLFEGQDAVEDPNEDLIENDSDDLPDAE